MPQKNWPTQAIRRIASAQFWFMSAEVKTAITLPKPLLIRTDVGGGEKEREQQEPTDQR